MKNVIKSSVTVMFGIMVLLSTLLSPVVYAAKADDKPSVSCDVRVLAIPAWYNGMSGPDEVCNFIPVKDGGSVNLTKTIGKIASNIIQALLVVAAYVAIFFLIKGGFTYIYSAGSPDGISSAKKAIQNALIGLVLAILAASIVNAIGAAI